VGTRLPVEVAFGFNVGDADLAVMPFADGRFGPARVLVGPRSRHPLLPELVAGREMDRLRLGAGHRRAPPELQQPAGAAAPGGGHRRPGVRAGPGHPGDRQHQQLAQVHPLLAAGRPAPLRRLQLEDRLRLRGAGQDHPAAVAGGRRSAPAGHGRSLLGPRLAALPGARPEQPPPLLDRGPGLSRGRRVRRRARAAGTAAACPTG
jgi:hypothetical protein